jgi:hypothetical protein
VRWLELYADPQEFATWLRYLEGVPADPTDAYRRLDAIRAELGPLEQQAKALRREAEQIALDLLRDGADPGAVAARCPFTATYLRRLARAAGIPPAKQGRRPSAPAD